MTELPVTTGLRSRYRFRYRSVLAGTLLMIWVLLPGWVDGQDKESGATIRVMSFNIRNGKARDGANHWNKRHDLVVEAIKQFKPDVLGTQETFGFQGDFLKKNLPGFDYYGRSREKDPNQGEQCAILYRKDRLKKISSGQFWLSETPEKKGSKSWDSSLPRIATWVIFADAKNEDRQFVFLNTHFDHRGNQARLESAKLIKAWLVKNHSKKPIVVAGDFNCGIDSKPFKALVGLKSEVKLLDSFRAANPTRSEQEGTFNGFRGKQTGARIDWVLHNEHFETQSANIDTFQKEGRYPSDHFPVTATLKWIPEKK